MAEEFNTQLIGVSGRLLELLRVPFTDFKLKENLENESYYPSMYTLSKIFNKYKVDNRGLKVEENQLDELPMPFLAHINIEETNAEDFVCVIKVDEKNIVYYYDKEYTTTREDFIENWISKVVFLVDTDGTSGEKDYDENKKIAKNNLFRKSSLLIGGSLILFYFIYNYLLSSSNILSSIFLLATTFLGIFISILLLIHEIDASNAFVKNICSGGTKTNCNAVLNSKGAKLFGVISWGEVGFFYFTFLALFILTPSFWVDERASYLTYLFIVSAIYTPYSLYYQYKVVKQWCPLCLLVQVVIVLNVFWVIFFGEFSIYFNLSSLVFFLLCAAVPILLWYTLKPIIIKAKDSEKIGAAYKRLVSREDIFELTLKGRPEAPSGWENIGIVKGNSSAENVILKLCNTSCAHCGVAHGIFNELLESNNNIKVITLYSIPSDGTDSRLLPVSHLLALAEEEDQTRIAQAMDYWYLNSDRTYDVLKEKFPVTEEQLERQKTKIDDMREWWGKTKIEYTPAIFVNGKQLPMTFNLEDLKEVYA